MPQQLSRIEQWQCHIDMIHKSLHHSPVSDPLINDPWMQYNIGQSQKCSVHILTFLQKNKGDPAIKVRIMSSASHPAYWYISCRIFPQNWGSIYFPIFKQRSARKLSCIQINQALEQPLIMKAPIISTAMGETLCCWIRISYITTISSISTSPCTTSGDHGYAKPTGLVGMGLVGAGVGDYI